MVILVLVNTSPNSATNNVGAAAITILVDSTFSMFGGERSPRTFRHHLSTSIIHDTSTILSVCITLFVLNDVVVYRLRSIPVVPTVFRATSTVNAINLSLNVAPKLYAISGIILVDLVCFNEINNLALVFTTTSKVRGGHSGCPLRGITINWTIGEGPGIRGSRQRNNFLRFYHVTITRGLWSHNDHTQGTLLFQYQQRRFYVSCVFWEKWGGRVCFVNEHEPVQRTSYGGTL